MDSITKNIVRIASLVAYETVLLTLFDARIDGYDDDGEWSPREEPGAMEYQTLRAVLEERFARSFEADDQIWQLASDRYYARYRTMMRDARETYQYGSIAMDRWLWGEWIKIEGWREREGVPTMAYNSWTLPPFDDDEE